MVAAGRTTVRSTVVETLDTVPILPASKPQFGAASAQVPLRLSELRSILSGDFWQHEAELIGQIGA
jgi:hypothetical protein